MGWHPSWFKCEDCCLVYLEKHPKKCVCGSDQFFELPTEDSIPRGHHHHICTTFIGDREVKTGSHACDDSNGFDLFDLTRRTDG